VHTARNILFVSLVAVAVAAPLHVACAAPPALPLAAAPIVRLADTASSRRTPDLLGSELEGSAQSAASERRSRIARTGAAAPGAIKPPSHVVRALTQAVAQLGAQRLVVLGSGQRSPPLR